MQFNGGASISLACERSIPQNSFTDLGLTDESWPAMPRCPPVFPSLPEDHRLTAQHHVLTWLLGFYLGSPYLPSKRFTKEAISPALLFPS